MLYLLDSGMYYKVGYTRDLSTFKRRMTSYKTHNPDFKLLGLRPGNKELEKTYHKGNTEWLQKDDNFNSIKDEFNLNEDDIEIMISCDLEVDNIVECEENPEGEIDTMVVGIAINKLWCFRVIDKVLYVSVGLRTFRINAEIDTFYLPYNEYGEKYWGIIINNNIIVYTYRSQYGEEIGIASKESPLYDEILKVKKSTL